MSGDKTVVQKPIDQLLDLMIANIMPITRHNYLKLMFFDDLHTWSAKHENQVSNELQDWHSKKEPSSQSHFRSHGFFI